MDDAVWMDRDQTNQTTGKMSYRVEKTHDLAGENKRGINGQGKKLKKRTGQTRVRHERK